MATKGIKTYKEAKINNMNQQELIVFLYESALRLMEEGKDKIRSGDIPGTHILLDRARNVFLHLLVTLNLDEGGEFAKQLSSLYSFFVEKITIANTTNNVQELEDIIPIVSDLKETWEKMEFDGSKQTPPGIDNKPQNQLISMEA